jgi:AhpD family alkylhydroperoxidase
LVLGKLGAGPTLDCFLGASESILMPGDPGVKCGGDFPAMAECTLCYYLPMSATTTNHSLEHATPEHSAHERKEPTFVFTEKQVSEKSEIARRFLENRSRLNANVDKANNFLVKRFYNLDHNAYLEGVLPAKTKELMGLVASACLRCDDCIIYHAIHAYRLGAPRVEQEESLNIALVIGGSIMIPHLRRAYELLEELYG